METEEPTICYYTYVFFDSNSNLPRRTSFTGMDESELMEVHKTQSLK